MEIRHEEEGHEEKRGGFCKVEVILISEENKNMAFFVHESE